MTITIILSLWAKYFMWGISFSPPHSLRSYRGEHKVPEMGSDLSNGTQQLKLLGLNLRSLAYYYYYYYF